MYISGLDDNKFYLYYKAICLLLTPQNFMHGEFSKYGSSFNKLNGYI